MRPIGTILVILFTILTTSAQSADDLRKKYGEPTSESRSEIFQIRPYNKETKTSVQLTVTYAKTGVITAWLIEIFPYPQERATVFSKEEADMRNRILDAAVDEVFPREKRGKNIINGFLSGTCPDDGCFGTFERYENITIFFNGNAHRYASITPGSDFLKISRPSR